MFLYSGTGVTPNDGSGEFHRFDILKDFNFNGYINGSNSDNKAEIMTSKPTNHCLVI